MHPYDEKFEGVHAMRILIADDSPLLRERLMVLLSEVKQIEVIGEAQDVPEALDRIVTLKPDTVILDIRMPGGNGIDVLRNIKRNCPNIAVIMFTNYPYRQYRETCRRAGADFFLDKSTEFEKLGAVLGNLLEQCDKTQL